jgi:hypothetical protein
MVNTNRWKPRRRNQSPAPGRARRRSVVAARMTTATHRTMRARRRIQATSITRGLTGSVQDPRSLDSVAASAYREMAANPQMKQVDYVGVHNGNAVLAYAPHGLGREPMFTAHADIARAQQQTAEEHLGRAQAIVETRAQAQAQEQSTQQQSQGGPAMGIGARTA